LYFYQIILVQLLKISKCLKVSSWAKRSIFLNSQDLKKTIQSVMANISSNDLVVNQPIDTADPDATLTIEIDSSSPLRPGQYQFQLVVSDESGNTSHPSTVNVIILDDKAPTAVLDAPERVSLGDNITLSGKRSTDIGGKIVRYEWTLIKAP
jgi:predicted secreted protein